MPTTTRFTNEVALHNRCLARELKRRYGVSFPLFKTLQVILQILGVIVGGYAMTLDAAPGLVFLGVVIIISGPTVLEVMISAADETDTRD